MLKSTWFLGALGLAACMTDEPTLVASNCSAADPSACVKRQALQLDAVDILLVIDDSASIAASAEALKAQLPRMLTAITSGQDEAVSFPPAQSVHVAVTTTNMGTGSHDGGGPGCLGTGQDGVFVKPGEVGVTCDVTYPGYLAYQGGPASIATVDSVSCVPLVFAEEPGQGVNNLGCGFEQPLEAALKSVTPSTAQISFLHGQGHGDAINNGFLRDSSLLVVVVVTDEDDCSAVDERLFTRASEAPPELGIDVNLRCLDHPSKLQPVQRYIDGLKQLRPNNDNVVFALIGGVPPNLVSESFRSRYDFTEPAQVSAYYDAVLGDQRMQPTPNDQVGTGLGVILPSCTSELPNTMDDAQPPRRLVEVARGFGAQGVLGSICAADFGSTVGQIIRAVGEKLDAAGGE